LLDSLIPNNIPKCYLEGYKDLIDDAGKIFPSSAEIIFTTNAYFSNEHFKVWSAVQKLKGAKLWVSVHGGHHGTALFNGPGELTETIADRFFCWGWGKYNLPSPKLSNIRSTEIKKTDSKILFIPYSVSKYSNHIDSSPISTSFNDCLETHYNFFRTLKAQSMENDLLVRLKSGKDLWNLHYEYSQCGITNFVYSHEETLNKSISKSSLVIVTYDSTVFLESLTLNVPTCLFLRRDVWEMSELAQKYFDSLEEVGIVHYDQESLFAHMLHQENEYDGWWNSDEVQIAIASFLEVFGHSSDRWEHDWLVEFKEEIF
jgi:putative transferase (TIGR04331 family)